MYFEVKVKLTRKWKQLFFIFKTFFLYIVEEEWVKDELF